MTPRKSEKGSSQQEMGLKIFLVGSIGKEGSDLLGLKGGYLSKTSAPSADNRLIFRRAGASSGRPDAVKCLVKRKPEVSGTLTGI